MKTSAVLEIARTGVESGWMQGEYWDANGNVCAMGAVYRAFGLDDSSIWAAPPGLSAACAELQVHLRGFGQFAAITQFNDDDNTTQQDVLDLFDKAIGTLQERGE